MAPTVYKICSCRDKGRCRHPWWFSFKRRGVAGRIRKSLDQVFEKHIEGKTKAEEQARGLRVAIVEDTLPPRTRELLGLPRSTKPVLETLTVSQLLARYSERHLAQTATAERQKYQAGAIERTELQRADGTTAKLGDWLLPDLTADALERLREARRTPGVNKHDKGRNRVGGLVAANRDLRLLRAAFNWALRVQLVERTPFKRESITTISLTKEQARSRRLQPGEEERLLTACNAHLHGLVVAALESGCRRGELLNLTWSQVTLDGRPELWLPADKTKTGKPRRVPISSRLKAVLEMAQASLRATLRLEPDQTLPGTLYVLGNEIGQRWGAIKTAWRLTCARAKIEDLHFHDLRREAGSRWMDAGVPLSTIQRWLGHTNISQTSTYLSTTTFGEHEAMRRFEEKMGRLTPIDTKRRKPRRSPGEHVTRAKSTTRHDVTKH